MPARVHIVCGPAFSGKTARLLKRYRTVARTSPGAALWLGPTRRNVAALRERLVRDLDCCLAPNVFAFQDFAEEVIRVNDPVARPLSDLQRRLLADELVAQLHARGELSPFQSIIDTRGFAEIVFEFLAELKRNEIWPEQFAEVVAHLEANRRGEQGLSLKGRQGALIYTRYQERLIQQQLYDVEGRFWYARDLLSRGRCQPFEAVRAVFIDGFTDFTRTQREILDALRGRVEELWLTLPGELGQDRPLLFSRSRAVLDSWAQQQPDIEDTSSTPGDVTAALAHLEAQLFRPLRAVQRVGNAEGIVCIEAPGLLGEARAVARAIKQLLLDGTPARDIVVTARDVLPYADLVREVFAEYGIPLDVEGTEALTRNPAVATLQRALRLPDEDWPFLGVTALLRSNYFQPDWPEVRACPDVAQKAEVLLRLLREPGKREAYLKATDLWADHPPPGLEDEQAEESQRQRKHELATLCRPFLRHFFHAWDGAPTRATLVYHTNWLRRLAGDLGIFRAAAASPPDALALERLFDELERWAQLQRRLPGGERTQERSAFLRTLAAVAAEAGLARTPRGPGRVRMLSATLARGLETPDLFVMGLGERCFPRLQPPVLFFDDAERQSLQQAGLDCPATTDLMADEMLLFYQTVTRARRRLVLSYPAVDDKGQDRLPSMFLQAVLDCFPPGAVPVQRQRMLIDGYDRQMPLSPAECRVQLAARTGTGGAWKAGQPMLPPALDEHLQAAANMAHLRFQAPDYNPYDGLLSNPETIAELGRRFSPDRIYSPTALEEYVACPFRFFLGHVLRLEPLDEPREEIESTKRGAAFHRALARLHQQLRDAGDHAPTEGVDAELVRRLDEAVEEYAKGASPASEVLWRLEGQRLRRSAARYRQHWEKFLQPWAERKVAPRPHLFEVAFGMPAEDGTTPAGPLVIRLDGVEVRIRGRIDRVDVAELQDGTGFWIIDYKTGRSGHYTGIDLQTFQRLQLTLYALAVEQVLLADRNARPLGLAYWLVADTGVKVALPGRDQLTWFDETQGWQTVREQLMRWVTTLITNIRQGAFPLKPRSRDCIATCNFYQVCRINQSRSVEKTWELPLPILS